ncbi:MAG: hypothetical protein P1U70_18735 [Saprospiraceae bacterium]|nr:hypothetical protein [Saprospiraceae bacterium]
MKKILILVFFFGTVNLFGQQKDSNLIQDIPIIKDNLFQHRKDIDDLTTKLNTQQYLIGKQKKSIEALRGESEGQKFIIDSLNQLILVNSQNIITNSKELGTKIQETGKNADSKFSALDSSLNKNRLYWIIATVGMLLLGMLVYFLLGKRIQSSKIDVETQIKNTKKSLEEESIKLDNKLVHVLETQLKLKQEELKNQSSSTNEEADHSLALKVADEIIRIRKNLSRMEEGTKGLKQLNSSVKRIQDNFAANGYEIVEMLGKEYKEGLKATVNFVQDDDFEGGKRIITRIIKPQVNYKETMIQIAQIEVTEA